jgi:hypothetical protein
LGTTPIGLARVPSNGSVSPSAVPTSYPGTVTEIGAVPPWTSVDGSTNGSGFVMLAHSSNQSLTGFVVNPATHNPTASFQCAVPASFAVDHIAKATYPYIVLAEHTSTDVTLNTYTENGGTCANGTQDFSALSQYGAGPSVASWNDAADDGVYAGGALVLGYPGNGQNAIVTALENGTASGGGNAVGTGSNQPNIDSLQMWYTKASVITKGIDEIAYRNATNFVQQSGLSASSPVSSAIDNAGHIYILFADGPGTVQKCSLGSPVSCTYVAAVGAYVPSSDHRAMALGPDGMLYFATTGHGVLTLNPANNTDYNTGTTSYSEAVASGDGHVYLLRADGSEVDAFP